MMPAEPNDSLLTVLAAVVTAKESGGPDSVAGALKMLGSASLGAVAAIGGMIWKFSAWKITQETRLAVHDDKIANVNIALTSAVDKMNTTLDKILKSFDDMKDSLHEQQLKAQADFVKCPEFERRMESMSEQFKELFNIVNTLKDKKADKDVCARHFSDQFRPSAGRDPL